MRQSLMALGCSLVVVAVAAPSVASARTRCLTPERPLVAQHPPDPEQPRDCQRVHGDGLPIEPGGRAAGPDLDGGGPLANRQGARARRAAPAVAHESEIRIALIIRNNQDDVGRALGWLMCLCRRLSRNQQQDTDSDGRTTRATHDEFLSFYY